jgi:fructosamine-3-kinase
MTRHEIYYWKCDRPAAFHGTEERGSGDPALEPQLRQAMIDTLETRNVSLQPHESQGNHLTWKAEVDGVPMFVRLENGPERDRYMAVESGLLDEVRAVGVPTPRVYACDATYERVPFAWHALELIDANDLNWWHRQGVLHVHQIAFDIGAAVARWQAIRPAGYGPFVTTAWQEQHRLVGHHATYPSYFQQNLDRHLSFLVQEGFFSVEEAACTRSELDQHSALLDLREGCLVHKDLALWNVLGTASRIVAFIDFDDAVSGDPMDDLALLGCFHDAPFLQRTFEGYQSVRALPTDYRRRFWVHLLRNMIVKAVIRVGAGYFERSDKFFLIDPGRSGPEFQAFTRERLRLALNGLQTDADISDL